MKPTGASCQAPMSSLLAPAGADTFTAHDIVEKPVRPPVHQSAEALPKAPPLATPAFCPASKAAAMVPPSLSAADWSGYAPLLLLITLYPSKVCAHRRMLFALTAICAATSWFEVVMNAASTCTLDLDHTCHCHGAGVHHSSKYLTTC